MKVGDYVYVLDNVHDSQMPKNRRDGLIVELVGKRKDKAVIMFSNYAFLKFHISQIQKVSKLYL